MHGDPPDSNSKAILEPAKAKLKLGHCRLRPVGGPHLSFVDRDNSGPDYHFGVYLCDPSANSPAHVWVFLSDPGQETAGIGVKCKLGAPSTSSASNLRKGGWNDRGMGSATCFCECDPPEHPELVLGAPGYGNYGAQRYAPHSKDLSNLVWIPARTGSRGAKIEG